METIPNEIAMKIFEHLTTKERIRCERVSTKWKELIRLTWKNFAFSLPEEYDMISISTSDEIFQSFVDFERIDCCSDQIHEAIKYFAIHAGSSIKSVLVCDILDGTLMELLVEKCPNIKEICFENCSFDKAVSPLLLPLNSCIHLEHLAFKHVHVDFHVKDKGRPIVASVKHLSLIGSEIYGDDLVFLSQNVGPTLESFFVANSEMNLVECFHFMPFIRNLNVHYSTISDDDLSIIAKTLTRLETLSLQGNFRITSKGINELVTEHGETPLRFLNSCSCTRIDDGILKGLNGRPQTAPLLNVFAFKTDIRNSLISESGNWKIDVTKPGPGKFFGFEASLDEEETSVSDFSSDDNIGQYCDTDDYYDSNSDFSIGELYKEIHYGNVWNHDSD